MPDSTLRAIDKRAFDFDAARHLLVRAGFGGTPAQVRALAGLGLDDAVDWLVDFDDKPAPDVERSFDGPIMRRATEQERRELAQARRDGNEAVVERYRRERQQRQRADRRQIADMQLWWMRRMIETSRPLEEKLTLLWHGHFATGYRAIENSWHMYRQNEMFRANAAGNFADLARGIVRDPAMLRYLNNDRNVARRPNENLAREHMELFCLGEGNGYTERDIKEGARALTGYTFGEDGFVFNRRVHDDGRKTILGQTGNWNGDDFTNILLAHRACSEFIAWKLYRFFVSDHPAPGRDAQAFVKRLAELMRKERYELRPVLRTLFRSRHFHDESLRASLVKSPVQMTVQAVREMHTPTRQLSALSGALALMGQNLFQPPSVKGWDGGRSWINTSTLFVRQNLMVYLLTGRRPEGFDWAVNEERWSAEHLLADVADESPAVQLDWLARFTLGRTPSRQRRAVLTTFLDDVGGRLDGDRLVACLGLISAMPEYQLC